MSPNGQYVVGTYFGDDGSTVGYIWRASDQSSHVLTEMNNVIGVNNLGVVSGSVPVNGGALFGGLDLGATGTIGMAPMQLTAPLEENANGYDIADDGTVVGLSFDVGYSQDRTKAFVWTPSQGMQVLATTSPFTYSRANAISSDGRVSDHACPPLFRKQMPKRSCACQQADPLPNGRGSEIALHYSRFSPASPLRIASRRIAKPSGDVRSISAARKSRDSSSKTRSFTR